jgi:Fe-S-cluster containining protein
MEKPVQITRVPKSRFYEKIFEIDERQRRIPAQISLSRLTKAFSQRVVTDPSVPAPDCIPCGACCFYGLVIPINRREPEPLERYIEVTLDDAPKVVVDRVFERTEADGRCVNLAGEVGVDISCNVYPDRPQVCRDFDAGSDRCFGYRRMFGIDPPLGPAELAAALEKLDAVDEPIKIRGIEIRIASKSMSFDASATDPAKMMVEVLKLSIFAHMSDGEVNEIHTFDPAKESWYEHELEGITLDAALKRIEERRVVS